MPRNLGILFTIIMLHLFLLTLQALQKVDDKITEACDFPHYENLSLEDKVKYDLFLSYSINSLYWMYCKLQAIDTSSVSKSYSALNI